MILYYFSYWSPKLRTYCDIGTGRSRDFNFWHTTSQLIDCLFKLRYRTVIKRALQLVISECCSSMLCYGVLLPIRQMEVHCFEQTTWITIIIHSIIVLHTVEISESNYCDVFVHVWRKNTCNVKIPIYVTGRMPCSSRITATLSLSLGMRVLLVCVRACPEFDSEDHHNQDNGASTQALKPKGRVIRMTCHRKKYKNKMWLTSPVVTCSTCPWKPLKMDLSPSHRLSWSTPTGTHSSREPVGELTVRASRHLLLSGITFCKLKSPPVKLCRRCSK